MYKLLTRRVSLYLVLGFEIYFTSVFTLYSLV
jgi:hypothetical protein